MLSSSWQQNGVRQTDKKKFLLVREQKQPVTTCTQLLSEKVKGGGGKGEMPKTIFLFPDPDTTWQIIVMRISFFCLAGICLTTDIDLLLFHMNNARYVRELDFARFDFFKRTGLFAKIKSKGGEVVQGGNSIRYRKFIRPFTVYEIRSKVTWTGISFCFVLFLIQVLPIKLLFKQIMF